MIKIMTVSFFGHREINDMRAVENAMDTYVDELLHRYEYIDFLVGKNGDFDTIVSASVRRNKRRFGSDNSSLCLVLPYMTAEYANNQKYYSDYYDEIEVYEKSMKSHFKKAYQMRNRYMVDRSDIVVFYVSHTSGGAYQAMQYAKKQEKTIINFAMDNGQNNRM